MKDRIRRQWEALGASDPYWGVLSDPARKGGRWSPAEFFQTGHDELAPVLARIADLGVPIRFDAALDFGCGVGRLSRALAQHFRQVIGIDLAESMLAEARAANRLLANIAFVHDAGDRLAPIADGSVDFIYCARVLQHLPRARQERIIQQFGRVLRPGGVAVFQAAAHAKLGSVGGWASLLLGNRLLNGLRRLKHGAGHVMEMHELGNSRVLELLRGSQMTPFYIERSELSGASFVGYRYYARRC